MNLPLNDANGESRSKAGMPEAGASCEAVWDLLSVYADKEANGDEAAMVESHIAVCSDCARDLQFMLETSISFSTVDEVEPPAYLRDAIHAATTDRQSIGRVISEMIQRFLAPAPARYGFAAVAGLAGIFVAIGINRGLPPATGYRENPAIYRPETAAVAPPVAGPTMANPFSGPEAGALKPVPVAPTIAASISRKPSNVDRSLEQAVRRAVSGPRLVASASGSRTAARTTVMTPRLSLGGEMKFKSPIADRLADPADEGTIHTADMVVMADPAPMTEPMSSEPGKKDPGTGEAPMSVPPARTRFTLVSTSSAETVGQAASLADLKRALRRRDADGDKAIEKSLSAREIRLPVLRKTF